MDTCSICRNIEKIKAGQDPYFVREMPTGYVVLSYDQYFKGYTLFMCKQHKRELFELDKEFRIQFMEDTTTVAQAMTAAFHADKINYELLGNGDAHLHWHLFPRRAHDMDEYLEHSRGPVWWLPKEVMYGEKFRPTPEQLEQMKAALRSELDKLAGA